MSPVNSRAVWIGSHTLVFIGWLGSLAGLMGDSLPLVAAASAVAVVGAQTALWAGVLQGHPRKRVAGITTSVVGGLLVVILVCLRLYAGPAAWSG